MDNLTIHHGRLLDSIAALMDSEKHADFIITCQGDRRFHVHKAIMCSASPALAAAFNVDMTESQTGVVDHGYCLPADLQVTVPAGDANNAVTVSATNAHLIAHARMYAIGEYYHLDTLQSLAAEKFAAGTTDDDASFETAGFIHVLRDINANISKDDRSFRDLVRTLALDNLVALTQDDTFMADLAELEDVQDFAAEMLRQVVRDRIREREVHDTRMVVERLECARVKAQLAVEQAHAKAVAAAGEQAVEHLQTVMGRLVDDVEALPDECRNAKCERVFGGWMLERKGKHGDGDWEVRCGRCRCRLCK
ncbi:hypothetical protein LTR08_003126 [Meristemomyces frigidus]|nr:hypothetical protein LTR08_003126 [Meristemomyces frigidus]